MSRVKTAMFEAGLLDPPNEDDDDDLDDDDPDATPLEPTDVLYQPDLGGEGG